MGSVRKPFAIRPANVRVLAGPNSGSMMKGPSAKPQTPKVWPHDSLFFVSPTVVAGSNRPSTPMVELITNLPVSRPACLTFPCKRSFVMIVISPRLEKKLLIPASAGWGRIQRYPLAMGIRKYLSVVWLKANIFRLTPSKGSYTGALMGALGLLAQPVTQTMASNTNRRDTGCVISELLVFIAWQV